MWRGAQTERMSQQVERVRQEIRTESLHQLQDVTQLFLQNLNYGKLQHADTQTIATAEREVQTSPLPPPPSPVPAPEAQAADPAGPARSAMRTEIRLSSSITEDVSGASRSNPPLPLPLPLPLPPALLCECINTPTQSHQLQRLLAGCPRHMPS